MLDSIPDAFFSWYWVLWLVLGFGIVEAIALFRDAPGDTLSERVRAWFGTEENPKGPAVQARRFVLLAVLAWLVVHWMTNGTFV